MTPRAIEYFNMSIQPVQRRTFVYVLIDFLIVLGAFLSLYVVRLGRLPENTDIYLAAMAAAGAFTVTVMAGFGVYRRLWERSSGHEVAILIQANIIATTVILLTSLAVTPRPFPVSVTIMSGFLVTCGMVATRYRSRLHTGLRWRWDVIWNQRIPAPSTRVLIMGAGESGQMLAQRLKHRISDHEYTVVGFVDDDAQKANLYVEGCRVLGKRADIPRLVEALGIDLIAIAIHRIDGESFRNILQYCEQTTAQVKIIPDVLKLMSEQPGASVLRDVTFEDLIGRRPIGKHEAVDLSPLRQKVILVTGAAGSIGAELCRQLMSYDPVKLIMLDNNESGLYDLQMELEGRCQDGPCPLTPLLADITDEATLESLFDLHRPEIIFHAAAYKHVPMLERYPLQALRVNLQGTLDLAKLAQSWQAERFVLISTDKAVQPTSVMGATKRLCEEVLVALAQKQDNRTRFASVRFGNVYGSRGSVVPLFQSQINRGGPVTVTHPDMTRYFMSIPEAVNLVIHAACLTDKDDTFFLRMGERVNILELAKRLIYLRGMRPDIDMPIVFTGMRPGEKMHEELTDNREMESPTVHPHIVKVRRAATSDPVGLLPELGQLLAAPPEEPVAMLERLSRLIERNYRADGPSVSDTFRALIEQPYNVSMLWPPEAAPMDGRSVS
jgi:FlaA1/EpsC-like NDP-sugar epimerase